MTGRGSRAVGGLPRLARVLREPDQLHFRREERRRLRREQLNGRHIGLAAAAVIEIPIRLRRRVGQSKGASQSLRKGLEVGLVMIWHIMAFTLKPATAEPSVEENSAASHLDGNGHQQLDPQPVARAKVGVTRPSRERDRVHTSDDSSASVKAEIPR
jgi:hypothetical protein